MIEQQIETTEQQTEQGGYGIISVTANLVTHLGLTIEKTTTQCELKDTGVFAALHEKLLLPVSYTIVGIFLMWASREWQIVVESKDLPLVEAGKDLPRVELCYWREANGMVRLSDIRVVQYDHGMSLAERLRLV